MPLRANGAMYRLGRTRLFRSARRPRWRHGCDGKCGRKYGGHCPARQPLRAETAETKSRAGRRRMGLPDALVSLLRKHKEEQERERQTAAQLWREGQSTRGRTTTSGSDSSSSLASGTDASTTPDTLRRRRPSCSACLSGPSWG